MVPISDVDRAKTSYTERVGFNADHDQRVNATLCFMQLTPPGWDDVLPPRQPHGVEIRGEAEAIDGPNALSRAHRVVGTGKRAPGTRRCTWLRGDQAP